jgi:hypothetical protein
MVNMNEASRLLYPLCYLLGTALSNSRPAESIQPSLVGLSVHEETPAAPVCISPAMLSPSPAELCQGLC